MTIRRTLLPLALLLALTGGALAQAGSTIGLATGFGYGVVAPPEPAAAPAGADLRRAPPPRARVDHARRRGVTRGVRHGGRRGAIHRPRRSR